MLVVLFAGQLLWPGKNTLTLKIIQVTAELLFQQKVCSHSTHFDFGCVWFIYTSPATTTPL